MGRHEDPSDSDGHRPDGPIPPKRPDDEGGGGGKHGK